MSKYRPRPGDASFARCLALFEIARTCTVNISLWERDEDGASAALDAHADAHDLVISCRNLEEGRPGVLTQVRSVEWGIRRSTIDVYTVRAVFEDTADSSTGK